MKHYIIAIILIISCAACDLVGSIDDIKPKNKLEDKDIISDENSAEQTVRGIYTAWRAFRLSMVRVNNYVLSGSMAKTGMLDYSEQFETNRIKNDNTSITELYRDLYGVINSANYAISSIGAKQIPKVSEDKQKALIADAKFHRALAHFKLLRRFGQFYDMSSKYGIVIRKEPYREFTVAKRNTVAETYQFILEDLDYASKYAPKQVSHHGYISQITAKSLKARVLLYTKKYEEAANLSKEIIGEAATLGYGIEPQFRDVFSKAHTSQEVLFAPVARGYDEQFMIPIDRAKESALTHNIANKLGVSLPQKADPRLNLIFGEDQYGNSKNYKFPHNLYPTTRDEQGNTYIFMRLSEVYLINAEAEARLGHFNEAKESLKVITNRVGFPEEEVNKIKDTELLEAIRLHKWMELICEDCEEWFDYIRYYKEGNLELSAIKTTITSDNQLIFPIPESARAGNYLLEPNP